MKNITASRREESDELFPVTRWSMVVRSGHLESNQAEEALESLCEAYRKPVSVLFRHWTRHNRIYSPDEWEDLTQSFFMDMMGRNAFAKAYPQAGRFRSFISICAQNFFRKDVQRRRAQRRPNLLEGVVVIDEMSGLPVVQPEIPAYFLRAWLKTLKARAKEALWRTELRSASFHSQLFEDLLPAICYEDKPSASQSTIATKYGLTRVDVAQRLHRWREAFRERVRAEILETVDQDPQAFEMELRDMLRVLADSGHVSHSGAKTEGATQGDSADGR